MKIIAFCLMLIFSLLIAYAKNALFAPTQRGRPINIGSIAKGAIMNANGGR